jgi:hypothetical protein
MKTATPKQPLIVDAAIDGSVIRGTLTAPSGERREFHGWLELNTALEATLDTRADRAPGANPAASAAVPASARDTRPTVPSRNPSPGPRMAKDRTPRPMRRGPGRVTLAAKSRLIFSLKLPVNQALLRRASGP